MKKSFLFTAAMLLCAHLSLQGQTLTVNNTLGCPIDLEYLTENNNCPPLTWVCNTFFPGNSTINSTNGNNFVGIRYCNTGANLVGDPSNANFICGGGATCFTPPGIPSSTALAPPGSCTDLVRLDWTSAGCGTGNASVLVTPL